ncbi:MAG: hypothetical protein ACP5NP_00330 [Acetobacteraceae bacterium]
MTPTETVLADAGAHTEVVATDGRRIVLRPIHALDRLRLFKAAGPVLAQNQPWLGMAALAWCVTAIDGVPVPTPANEAQIEALVTRLGDDGIEAIAAALDAQADATEARSDAGN